MNRNEPAPIEDRYRGPASDEPAADTSRLSKDEWRYAAKVFAIATLAWSILAGLWLTMQTIYALRAFNAEARVAGIVAVSAFLAVASRSVLAAVCLALVLVVHRRTKNDVAPPRSGLFVPMFLIVPAVTPLAGLLICTVSMLLLVFGYDQPFALALESIDKTFLFSDVPVGILLAAGSSIVIAGLSAELARLLARVQGWPILKYIILTSFAGVVASIVGGVLLPIFYFAQFGKWP
jgi:hypothetical protein